jgi:hypothetical protein
MRKPSLQGSVLADNMRGGSVSDRGNLGRVGDVQLRGVGVVIGLECRGGAGFAHLVTLSPFSFSYSFPPPKHPLSLYPSSLIPPGGSCIYWVQWWWWM